MEAKQLLSKCADVIRTYDPNIETVDVHAAQSLSHITAKDDAALVEDAAFIQQVFYGCVRMDKCLRVFLNALYHIHASELNRADHTLFMVLSYVGIFRLDEIGFSKFASLLASQDTPKMFTLLSFMFSSDSIDEWVKEQWCRFLDRSFVEGRLLATLDRHRPSAQKWMDDHRELAFGGSRATEADGTATLRKSSKRSTTVPIPPNITAPRPRVVPEPERIAIGIKAKPVPQFIASNSLRQLDEVAQQRRERTRSSTASKYDPRLSFKLHETQRTADKIRAEVEAREAAQLRFDGFRARSPPKWTQEARVKLNAAAILREDAIYKDRQMRDAKLIERYEMELHDLAAHNAWRAEQAERDGQERAKTVEMRRREMATTAQAAVESHAAKTRHNAEIAAVMRQEAQALLGRRGAELDAEREYKRRLVQVVKQDETVMTAKAKEELVKERRLLREAVRAETKQLELDLAANKEQELRHRADVIRQIRALERVPKRRVTTFDPAEVGGEGGLLEEMSLVELRERLSILRERQAEAIAAKRQAILRDKEEAVDALKDRIASISQMRARAATTNEQARQAKLAEAHARKVMETEMREKAVLETAKRLEEKRQKRETELLRIREESERIAKQNMFLGVAKAIVEEHRFQSRVAGMERRAALEQVARRKAFAVEQATRARRGDSRARWRDSETKRAAENEASLSMELATTKQLTKEMYDAESGRKEIMVAAARAREKVLKVMTANLNPYAAKMRTSQDSQRLNTTT